MCDSRILAAVSYRRVTRNRKLPTGRERAGDGDIAVPAGGLGGAGTRDKRRPDEYAAARKGRVGSRAEYIEHDKQNARCGGNGDSVFVHDPQYSRSAGQQYTTAPAPELEISAEPERRHTSHRRAF
jgi:hypothetical protein